MAAARYLWRKLTPKQRDALLAWRKRQRLPWHRPPHLPTGKTNFHITAACFEHRHYLGQSFSRIQDFCGTFLDVLCAQSSVHAWCVLPNHYHALVETPSIGALLRSIGRMHGRVSYDWNGEDGSRGRQVWCGAVDRFMRSERHFWATLNYVHHNPVHHHYVQRWPEWPYSSATEYLNSFGAENARRVWNDYPVRDYGRDWDPPEL